MLLMYTVIKTHDYLYVKGLSVFLVLLLLAQVHIVLTGGSQAPCDSDYFDYVIDKLPKKDVSASWDRLGEGLHSKDKMNLFARLPDHVSDLHPCGTSHLLG